MWNISKSSVIDRLDILLGTTHCKLILILDICELWKHHGVKTLVGSGLELLGRLFTSFQDGRIKILLIGGLNLEMGKTRPHRMGLDVEVETQTSTTTSWKRFWIYTTPLNKFKCHGPYLVLGTHTNLFTDNKKYQILFARSRTSQNLKTRNCLTFGSGTSLCALNLPSLYLFGFIATYWTLVIGTSTIWTQNPFGLITFPVAFGTFEEPVSSSYYHGTPPLIT